MSTCRHADILKYIKLNGKGRKYISYKFNYKHKKKEIADMDMEDSFGILVYNIFNGAMPSNVYTY